MALKPREKTLAVVTGSLLAVVAGWQVLSFLTGPMAALRTQRKNLEQEVQKKQSKLERAESAYHRQHRRERLADWKQGSLDSDPQVAGLQYQNWLLGLCDDVGFRRATVVSNPPRNYRDVCIALPFTVTGRGNLGELTTFLHDFYADTHLHKIRRLTVKPIERSSDLDLTITVEAVSLQNKALATIDSFQELIERRAKQRASSPPGDDGGPAPETPPSLAAVDLGLEEYLERIVRRNLFTPYRRPPPRPPARPVGPPREERPGPPSFDPSKYAFVNAIVEVDGKPQVWLKARTTGKKYELFEGDPFQLGTFRATIARIGRRDVEIEIDGKRRLVALGDSLHEGIELPEP